MIRACRWAAAIAAGLATGSPAAQPRPPTGVLMLDMADPVISVRIADSTLRLRVDPDQRNVIELNRSAADRLSLPFEAGSTDAVGRIAVASRVVVAPVSIDGHDLPMTLSTHGTCCAGVDGAISPALLPYALVRFVRAGSPAGQTQTFTMRRNGDFGLEAYQPIGRETVRLRFSLDRVATLATASAGAILAQANGGRFDGGPAPVPVAFGVERPARMIAFARPVRLAGFAFDRILARTADFGGRRILPQEPKQADEIVVKRRVRGQREWPAIVIGRDRLDRCSEISFSPPTALLTLRCDFDGAAP